MIESENFLLEMNRKEVEGLMTALYSDGLLASAKLFDESIKEIDDSEILQNQLETFKEDVGTLADLLLLVSLMKSKWTTNYPKGSGFKSLSSPD